MAGPQPTTAKAPATTNQPLVIDYRVTETNRSPQPQVVLPRTTGTQSTTGYTEGNGQVSSPTNPVNVGGGSITARLNLFDKESIDNSRNMSVTDYIKAEWEGLLVQTVIGIPATVAPFYILGQVQAGVSIVAEATTAIAAPSAGSMVAVGAATFLASSSVTANLTYTDTDWSRIHHSEVGEILESIELPF